MEKNEPVKPIDKIDETYVNIEEGTKEMQQPKIQPQKMNIITAHEYERLKNGSPQNKILQPGINGGIEPVRIRKLQRVGTACCDYVAKEKDELSIRHGSVVEILRERCDETGWVLAKVDNKKGMVPKNYVILIGSQPSVIHSEEIRRTTQLLGSGGFADVFLGYYKSKDVALKVSRTNSDRDRETLTREALILSRIEHKNIVTFYGLSLNPLFIVLELCQGGTLFTLGRKMSSSDVLTVVYWARQVGEAIQYLHSREDPLVYADLKAENVLIKEPPCLCGLENESWKIVTNYRQNGHCRKCDGLRINMITLKLADFNVSRTLSVKRDSCAGSLLWMPPEVIKHRDFSKSSDVWSFGMFLWEVFSRKVPFKNYELHAIFNAIVYKKETLPLPEDLPSELRVVFEQCWRKLPEERPSITEILDQLGIAEQTVDNHYKWMLQEENNDCQKSEQEFETDVLESISKECREGKSVTIPLYEVVMYMERLGIDQKLGGMIKKLGISFYPPTPAKRQKKQKLDKESIGIPCDFRHNVSARLRSASPPLGERSSSREKLLVIRYLENEENSQTKYRSHDSLVGLDKDDGKNGYSTLPRMFRQKTQSQSQNMSDDWMTNKLKQSQSQNVNLNRTKADHSNLENESNLDKADGKTKHRPCIFQHDYLILDPCACAGNCKHGIISKLNRIALPKCGFENNKNKKAAQSEEGKFAPLNESMSSNEESKERQYTKSFNESIKLSRTNAIRPKINDQQQSQHESNQSSSCSSSLDGFVVVGGSKDLHNHHDHPSRQMNLPEIFNRRISPPQYQSHQQSSVPNSSCASMHEIDRISGKGKRGRKVSTEVPNSIFYVPPMDEESLQSCSDFDNRHRSGPVSWVNRFFGASSRQSTSADDEMSENVIETAECYHPSHSSNGFHLCALRPAAALLPETNLTPVTELNKINFMVHKIPSNQTLAQRNAYRKRIDCQDKQRQSAEFSNFSINTNVKPTRSPTDIHGVKERLSVHTVIGMQQPIGNNQNIEFDVPNLNLPQQSNPARSYTDLNNHFVSQNQSVNSSLLSPDRIMAIHQRSKSTENSFSQATKSSELVQKLLEPLPSNGLILNPSYIPMRDSQKEAPPLPSKSKTKNGPIPLPRSKISPKGHDHEELPWPTSQAPMLNRAEAELPGKLILRPNSLGLKLTAPIPQHNLSSPLTTPTTTNSFTNSSTSFGGAPNIAHIDSGIDPEPGTEAENSPYPTGPRTAIEFSTVFPCAPNISPISQIPFDNRSRRPIKNVPMNSAPLLPTNPPPPPPLPPKRIDGIRIPPIPKTIKKNRHF